ncbi:protein kinase domain-containing protein [Thalassotalea marina]|uniref:Protein kinase domain-containing protein n=1 Tax=Thalassotalea marina TaxID=1673741 RepID=A0A919EPD0_9GAMM|nr:protein kinase [Thalassotalea marina]GHG03182.1 hypothetical protein GCM10017161_35420 [Thalassotalea marina]
MNFDTSLALFQHLLEVDEQHMLENLSTFIDENHDFYHDVIALICAHHENMKQTKFKVLIGKQADQLVEDSFIHELVGQQVGVYKLVKKLGQGGMGAVYLGERNDGQLEQKVAIKFVYPSISLLAGKNFLQSEAQYLANLEHVYIARLYTLGALEQELQYMVMEYVDGVAIDQYCITEKLDAKTRLTLFLKVCRAVQFAHKNMVIHADIKPSNILVDQHQEPKLMDFGIANSFHESQCIEENNSNLAKGNIVAASREFASPEQIEGKKLTTASDIFSLGMLLKRLGINNEEVTRISNRCCRQNIEERYDSVELLMLDIQNHQANYPLQEDSNSTWIKVKKSLQRNVVFVGIAVLFIGVVAAFSTNVYFKSQKLETSLAKQKAVAEFMISIFQYANVTRKSKIGKYTVEEMLTDISHRAKTELEQYPEARLAVLYEMAKSYQAGKNFQRSKVILDDIESIYDFDQGNIDLGINFYVTKAYVADKLGEPQQAQLAYERVDELALKLGNYPSEPEQRALAAAAVSKSYFLYKQGKHDLVKLTILQALNQYQHVISLTKKSSMHNTLGVVFARENDFANALIHLEKSIALLAEKYGSNRHASVLQKRLNLIETYILAKEYKRAETGLDTLIQDIKVEYGVNSPIENESWVSLARVYRLQGNCSKAATIVASATNVLLEQNDKTDGILALMEQAKIEACTKQVALSKQIFSRAINIAQQQFGKDSYKHLVAQYRFYNFQKEHLGVINKNLLADVHALSMGKYAKRKLTQNIIKEYQVVINSDKNLQIQSGF